MRTRGRGRPSGESAATPILAGNQAADAERLPTVCWCGRRVLWVPKDRVRAGVTGSCGSDGCDEEGAA